MTDDISSARVAAGENRVVWDDTRVRYPPLLAAGHRVARCHDLTLTEGLLLGHEGRHERGRGVRAALARLRGEPEPAEEPSLQAAPTSSATPASAVAGRRGAQASLFDEAGSLLDDATGAAAAQPVAADLDAVHADQARRIAHARAASPGFALLVAAESAAALAAVEMTAAGLPWDAVVHDALLTGLLGPRPAGGGRPPVLAGLAQEVARLLEAPRLNPDSRPELLRALHRAGVPVSSTRRAELARAVHPVVAPLLRYKELARLHSGNGWAWREQWVSGGRLRPDWQPGTVVSGRWATRGGGALQIPHVLRAAVVAEPGHALVVADAGQLEPRMLAALSRDPQMVTATQAPDLYAAVAQRAFGAGDARSRATAKVALLSAMYGGTGGPGARDAMSALRGRFPRALDLLEAAAATGEEGGSVRSVLGRTSPAARGDWLEGLETEAAQARRRAQGRFTRNFVVQASAADWASVLLACLRTQVRPDALVLFQHDEVVLHVPAEDAQRAVSAVAAAGEQATRLVIGDAGVRIPLQAHVVRCYADISDKGGQDP